MSTISVVVVLLVVCVITYLIRVHIMYSGSVAGCVYVCVKMYMKFAC